MPLIKVQTSVSAPEKAEIEAMLKNLSAKLAKHTSKPESYVMILAQNLFSSGILS